MIKKTLWRILFACAAFYAIAGAYVYAQSFTGVPTRGSATSTGWTSDGSTTSTTQAVSVASTANVVGITAQGSASKGAIKTTGGSGGGDITVSGDAYFGNGLGFSIAAATRALTSDGSIHTTSTKTAGVVTLSGGGTATVTVVSGSHCACNYSTVGVVILLCNVVTTTLTITGTAGSDVGYVCI